jgi:asparaginyl-tRNA synthetase
MLTRKLIRPTFLKLENLIRPHHKFFKSNLNRPQNPIRRYFCNFINPSKDISHTMEPAEPKEPVQAPAETSEPEMKTVEPTVVAPTPKTAGTPPDFGLPGQYMQMPIQETIYSGHLRLKALLTDPHKYIDTVQTVGGWAKTVRKQKLKEEVNGEQVETKLLFVELSDGTCQRTLQIVVTEAMGPSFEEMAKSSVATCFQFTGTIIKSPKDGQVAEMNVSDPAAHKGEVIGANKFPGKYPLGGKGFIKPETLRNSMHLRPRSNLIGASMRIRNSVSFATHLFFQAKGFFYIHTPIITCSDCEGAGEMFGVTTLLGAETKIADLPEMKKKKGRVDYGEDFFKRQAFLTVSGQLAVEPFACSMSNVYTFGPTFRAEKSDTSRHLAEFWMVEPELVFAGMKENMQCSEDYVKYCIDYCLKNNLDDIEFMNEFKKKDNKDADDLVQYLTDIVNSNFRRMPYTEAIDVLLKAIEGGKVFEVPVSWGMDLNSEHERYLCEVVVKGPVFLFDYPKGIKPFYMKVNDDGKTVGAMDMLVPGIGEVIGGSVREEKIEVLEARLKECGLNKADYDWYLDLRRYGTVPHAGFGLGLERMCMLISSIQNIRDVIPYPRWMENVWG